MQLSPGQHQSFLTSWKKAGHPLDSLHTVNPDVILIVGVKMGQVVRAAGLDEHPNHDSEKARNLGHIAGDEFFRQTPPSKRLSPKQGSVTFSY